MPKYKSKDICSACGGRLNYEGGFRRDQYRFDLYRCESCKKPFEFGMDPFIKDEFPQIRKVSIEVVNERTRISRRFSENDNFILFCCPNHKCTNPGIYVPRFLQEMLDNHQTHREYYHLCDGFEPSPKWRRKKPCDQSFWITIDIVLRNSEASGGQS